MREPPSYDTDRFAVAGWQFDELGAVIHGTRAGMIRCRKKRPVTHTPEH